MRCGRQLLPATKHCSLQRTDDRYPADLNALEWMMPSARVMHRIDILVQHRGMAANVINADAKQVRVCRRWPDAEYWSALLLDMAEHHRDPVRRAETGENSR